MINQGMITYCGHLSALQKEAPNGFCSSLFNYVSFDVASKEVEELRRINLDGFRPWMVLCRDGARREVVDEVLNHLYSWKRANLVLLTRFYAEMVFESEADKSWLQRRFAMLQEFVFEESQTYQDIIQEGLERGIAEGRAEGSAREARWLITTVTQARFPDLSASLTDQIEQINDLEKLREISLLVSTAQSAEEIRQSLLELV